LWSIDVFRRQHVYGQLEIVSQRLPRAVSEARRKLHGDVSSAPARAERWRT
jgi:hypothetical protein